MIKIVYMATPEIAVNAMKKLLGFSDIHMVGAVTMPDRPSGRGLKSTESPVKKFAVNNGVTLFQTDSVSKDRNLIEQLKKLEPDFFVTFAFGQMLSEEIINLPKYGTINLHASLLPKYRGANPIQRAIVNGDKETGITTMKTVLKMDAGDICLSEKITVTENMTAEELSDVVSDKAPYLIYRTLKGLVAGTVVPVPQDESMVTFASKYTKEDAAVDFNVTSEQLHNKVRGLCGSNCACISNAGKNVKLIKTEKVCFPVSEKYECGQIISVSKDGVTVMCCDAPLLIKTVKPESKSEMSAVDWINGLRLKPGDII